MNTLLPVPVEPAISRCGICVRSAARMRPIRSLPSGSVSLEGECENSGDSITSRRAMVSRRALGTSMPTVDLPGMRSIRIDSARSARQRSSARPVMRLYLMPASGLNSNVVTTGPGIDLRDVSRHAEFRAFLLDGARAFFQLALVHLLAALGRAQQAGGRQPVVRLSFGNLWGAALFSAAR